MTTWQYMAVMASTSVQGEKKLIEFDATGDRRDIAWDSSISAVLQHLNRLGAQGWDVVNVDPPGSAGGWSVTTYLLKKPS